MALFKAKRYEEAIDKYIQALAGCDSYEETWMGKLPYKSNFGVLPTLEDGSMFFQEFVRLKSALNNAVAKSYFKLEKWERCDLYNSTALIEDPDYIKAIYWKSLLLEKMGEFKDAVAILEWAMKKLHMEKGEPKSKYTFYETDEAETEILAKMQWAHDRCEKLVPKEKEVKRALQVKKEASVDKQVGGDYDSEYDQESDSDGDDDIFQDDDIKKLISDIMKETTALDRNLKDKAGPIEPDLSSAQVKDNKESKGSK